MEDSHSQGKWFLCRLIQGPESTEDTWAAGAGERDRGRIDEPAEAIPDQAKWIRSEGK